MHPTLAQPVRTGCAHCAQAARTAPCRGARWVVSWPPPRPYRGLAQPCRCAHTHTGAPCRRAVSRPSVTIQKLYRDPSSCRAPDRIAGRVAARCFRIAALIVTQVPPQAMIQTIVSRLTPGQATRARAAARPAGSRPCRRLYYSSADRVAPPVTLPSTYHSAVSWPGSPACHDTKHCIVTQHQMGSSPFPVSFLHFFFHIFFSLLIPATGKSPKTNVFFFHFLVNRINFLKFILSILFFQFYTL